jgi:hydroxyethylthiazole kinase-like uncharacterized protein yjeF
MTDLLTAAQMRAIESAAIDGGTVTGLELMERAGQGVVDAMREHWPALATGAHHATILCGPGNNGGDGFVVARLLKTQGWEVALYLFGRPDRLPPDARTNHDRWAAMGAVHRYEDAGADAFCWNARDAERHGVLVDALFGTGLTRPVTGFDAFGRATARDARDPVRTHVVAVDLPSGLCADSGRLLRPESPPSGHAPIAADLTVTFHRCKLGHVLAEGPAFCGRVAVRSIGLEDREADADASRAVLAKAPTGLSKTRAAHKYAHGHALVLSGPPGAGGAARLAARGALRIGAGLVSVCCENAAVPEHAARLDAVMIKPAEDAAALARLLEDGRLNALCLGPGLGAARARDLVPVALRAGRTSVLDADALTAFADAPETLFELLHEGCVLTPHAGEFARVFPDIAEDLKAPPREGPAYSRVDATRAAAARAGCVVLLKGPDTVIAAPDGRCVVHAGVYDRAAPWLATAGTGDVLAGFITGLLARGFPPLEAASTAAWLHTEAARRFGPGLVSEDLSEMLPGVLAALEGPS